MTEEQIKHLEFIQGIINRMNSNSFAIKGWAITIISALLALYASSSNETYVLVAIVPTILFWFLDAYYLQQERKFRGIYNDIVNNSGGIKFLTCLLITMKKGNIPIVVYFGRELSLHYTD